MFVLICRDFADNLSKDEKTVFLEMLELGSKVHSAELPENEYGVILQRLKEVHHTNSEQ
jgi:hypothetical protein